MKKTAIFLAAALFLIPTTARVTASQAAETAQSVIDKHIAALGGRDALMKITSRKATGIVSVTTPAGELSGPVELYSKAPNKSRAALSLDLSAVGGPGTVTIEQIFDGNVAWGLNPLSGDQEITGTQLENMKNSLFPTPFLDPTAGGNKVELMPRETVAGKAWIVLKVTRPSGNFITFYFDPDTYLLARTLATVDNPMSGGTMTQSGETQDYRVVDGIKVPFVVINTNDAQTITIKLNKVEHNVAIDDAMFKKK